MTAEELQEEEAMSLRLRPSRLKDYIGQEQVKENLAIALRAARERHEPLEHVLFYGPPGLGKTTLAHIIAAEMEVGIKTSSGPALERAADLIGILTTMERGEVFFIDEIHRLPRVVEEYMYGAMEDFAIDFVQDKGPYARTIKLSIQPFTLVGATTRSGLLTAPLRERFGIFHHLDFYPEDDLVTIVTRSAKILSVPLEATAAREVARRARGTPRIANRLLRRVRDYAQVKGDGSITLPMGQQALDRLGVDARGLDDLDRKLLTTIIAYYQGGPVGIEALAATLGEQTDTLEEVVEPYLLKIGFISRTTRGRKATDLAYEHLHLERGGDQPTLF